MLQPLYRGLTRLGGPLIHCYLARRRAAGKEDAARLPERLGVASRPRPAGPLVWFHAASVGESLSILVLVERLLARTPALSVLVTTGTVTSAELMAGRLPPRAFHQYVPVDRPSYAARFLDHWRPDLVLWVESEIWPNLLWDIGRRGIPAALVNARLSERSFARWRRVPGFIAPLLAPFALSLAQTEDDADRLRRLGARDVRCVGNLKYSADPPAADPAALAALLAVRGSRPTWLLASSHPGEDELAADVHAALAGRLPDLLTVIVPRHPQRGEAVAAMLRRRGLTVSRRAGGNLPTTDDAVHIGDTLGEMGLYYRLAPVVCMGGSFIRHGGQNPIEPAKLGCAVLYGPHMFNFRQVTTDLEAAGAACPVADGAALAESVGRLLTDGAARERLMQAGRRVAERNRRAVDDMLAALEPVLNKAGIAAQP